MSDVISSPRPDPDADPNADTSVDSDVGNAPNDAELEEFRAWKQQRQASMAPLPPPVALSEAATSTDDEQRLADENRLAAVEYRLACLPSNLFGNRAPFTNPVDDFDHPPMQDDPEFPNDVHRRKSGTWEDHPWHGLAQSMREDADK